MVNWSLDLKNYDTSDVTAISSFILDNVVDGDVVLCHDGYVSIVPLWQSRQQFF
jgi:hypothetical protein